jgi:hypothetical protein
MSAVVIMPALVRTKLRLASAVRSRALKGDAACGVGCVYMAATFLAGLVLRSAFWLVVARSSGGARDRLFHRARGSGSPHRTTMRLPDVDRIFPTP